MDYSEKILQFRKQFPIGIKSAERYLTAANGSLEEAVHSYISYMEDIFIVKTQASRKDAGSFLSSYQYDLGKAIDAWAKLKYSFIEYVILHTKDKKKAIRMIGNHVAFMIRDSISEQFYGINDTDTSSPYAHDSLQNNPKCLAAYKTVHSLNFWMDYYGWEGCLYWDTKRNKAVVANLNKLGFKELAKHMDIIVKEIESWDKNQNENTWDNKTFRSLDAALEKYYLLQEEELINALYDFVSKNLDLFCY